MNTERIDECLKHIEQCQKYIDLWRRYIDEGQEAIRLLQQRLVKPQFGDIVVWTAFGESHRRIWLYDLHGSLGAFDKRGICVGTSFPGYVPTGENIFESDLLRLDI